MSTQQEKSALEGFAIEVTQWLDDNCPLSMRQPATMDDLVYGGKKAELSADQQLWLDRMASKGWTVPTWPSEYGGGGLSAAEAKVLKKAMAKLGCRPPLIGHAIWMLGPALLEYGSEQQKQQHLPQIVRGEIRWCQGYSEPGAGSDLANIRCKAVDQGDHYLVSGQKSWTTDGDKSDWMFCLVRTDDSGKKQHGISFVLIDMDQPGMAVIPVPLINGTADFCDSFLDNVVVAKDMVVGEIDKGWSVAKGLLVHERTMMADLQAFMPKPKYSITELAGLYAKNHSTTQAWRDDLARQQMDAHALGLTQARVAEESRVNGYAPAAMALKYIGTELDQQREELAMAMLGSQGLGNEGEGFAQCEVDATKSFLLSKALTIGGGTSEVQLNMVAKHRLKMPD
ncbi:Putative acyl-CoA dehydrogenase FadE17 [Sinobacterium norvegicum]|uniref:Acyl-CoA dehydrogenase FadE17 n=1 Tax=Sinobacterium norvegicum TaxID=1641715 RepID=A0ABM9AFG9_9GAMM|nr:acyl-CoA dehydrogenase family protein [Sinobacterium norvegicum]CAH0991709.1 Putative acyl-CoA dehydrogenase FadE17 [Sinobacterium norvegicum]